MEHGRRRRLEGLGHLQEVVGETFDRAALASLGLVQVRFKRCSLVGVDLRHATLDGCWFTGCDLSRAQLRAASLRGAMIRGCDLRGADLRDCDLSFAMFGYSHRASRPTDLTDAAFDGAVLTGATFRNVLGRPVVDG